MIEEVKPWGRFHGIPCGGERAGHVLLPVAQVVAWNQGRFVTWLQFTRLVWGTSAVSGRELLQKDCERIVLLDELLTTA